MIIDIAFAFFLVCCGLAVLALIYGVIKGLKP